jgi:hypothetical protein
MGALYTNNAKTTLSADLNNSATSLGVASSSGFPSLSGSHYFYATLDDQTNLEVVKVTAVSGTTWTIVRGQDDTSARAFSSGDTIELRLNSALLTDVVNEALASSFTRQAFEGDGSDTTFTLNKTPSNENDLIVFIEGVFQTQSAYSLSGTTLTFSAAPADGREIIVYHVSAAVSGDSLALNTYAGDGSTVAFTMSVDPLYENNTMVFIDGVYQNKSTYATSGTTLTFDTAPANGTAIDVTTHTQQLVNVPVDASVSTAKLADDAVTVAKMAVNSIDSDQYIDASIDTAHIKDAQITTAKIAADAVTGAKIADNAVVTANITDGNVTTAKIADDQVTLAKMAGLARGKIIVGDSSGNPAALAVGSNGQVLKSDGTDISWGTDATVAALTSEQVQDIAGAMFSSNTETGIAATYQDGDGTIDLVIGDDTIVSSMLDTNIDIAGTLDVTGATTLDSTLAVAGATTLGSSLAGNGAPFTISNTNNGNNIDIKTTASNSLVHAVKIHSGGLFEAKQGAVFNEDSNDVDFRVESNGSTHMFFVDAGANKILMSSNPASDTQSVPHDTLTLAVSYADSGANGVAGLGPRIAFKIPDDEDNPSVGGGIAVVKESADDSDSSSAMTFATTQNDETLDEAMRITSVGNLGIGTASPSRIFEVALTQTNASLHNNSTAAVHFGSEGNADGLIQGISLGYKSAGANTYAKTAIVARGLNDGAGRQDLAFLVDTAADGGSAELGDAKLTINGATGVVSGDLNDTSDIAFKENILDLGNTLDLVKQLQPKTFTWKNEKAERGDSVGFIAQDVKSIIPDSTVVHGTAYEKNGDGGYSINTIGLVAYLTKAIQEQQTIIEDLKARIETLEG